MKSESGPEPPWLETSVCICTLQKEQATQPQAFHQDTLGSRYPQTDQVAKEWPDRPRLSPSQFPSPGRERMNEAIRNTCTPSSGSGRTLWPALR